MATTLYLSNAAYSGRIIFKPIHTPIFENKYISEALFLYVHMCDDQIEARRAEQVPPEGRVTCYIYYIDYGLSEKNILESLLPWQPLFTLATPLRAVV